MATARAFVSDVLEDIGVLAQGETAEAGNAVRALRILNDVLDLWNTTDRAVYADETLSFTLTASLSPHTLGPDGATWAVATRPVEIKSASLEVSNTRTPLAIQDADWYAGLTTPEDTSEQPTALYPEYAWPNANLYFYPVPTSAYTVHLRVRRLLESLALDDEFDVPPGYRLALRLTVDEQSLKPFGQPPDPELSHRASKARAAVFSRNVTIPKICTDVVGSERGYYNYLTGRSE